MASDLLRAFFFFFIYILFKRKEGGAVEFNTSKTGSEENKRFSHQLIRRETSGTPSVGGPCADVTEVRTGNKKIGSLDSAIVKVNVGGRVLYLFNAPAD